MNMHLHTNWGKGWDDIQTSNIPKAYRAKPNDSDRKGITLIVL